ncbi:MAG: COQ9 family protein [Pseudomonadota bacterium]
MTDGNRDIKDRILGEALEDAAFDGWQWSMIEDAAEKAGFEKNMAMAVFPEKINDVMIHFSDWADRETLKALSSEDFSGARVRDKIQEAVWQRLQVLSDHKEATRKAMAWWIGPTKIPDGGKMVWKTADSIWEWAGDTATDYNHYTKRALLSGVLSATMLRWINDDSPNHKETRGFLERRIDNVLTVGQKAGRIMGKFSPFLDKVSFLNKQK